MNRLFLNNCTLTARDNLGRVLAPCRLHSQNPLAVNGQVVWKRNNLHFTWYRENDSGEFVGWHTCHSSSADQPEKRWQPHVRRCRSQDGLAWEDSSEPGIAETVIRDPSEADPERLYRCVYQGIALLDDDGAVQISTDRYDELLAAAGAGRDINLGIFSACSADGIHWHDHRPVVIDTYRVWDSSVALGHNPDLDQRKPHQWWIPGWPGWAGGDSFPCLLHVPEERKYVAFYRTNIDRRNSRYPQQRRRERAVGRSECTTFGEWGEHELALHSNVDWQHALGYGKQDFYQLQAWPCGDVYLGIVSVFYWEEDRNRLELAWSPDTVHWERVCPYTDLVPHGELGEFGGGCSYASMRPQEIDGEVRVYFGADHGRHNADSQTRESTLMLALFDPDRFAGLTIKGTSSGSLVTVPLEVSGDALRLNANAKAGRVRVELQDESGQPLDGFNLDDCDPARGDALDAVVSWKGNASLASVKGRSVRMRIVAENSILYAFDL